MNDPLLLHSMSDEFWDERISRYVGAGLQGVTWQVRFKQTDEIESGHAMDEDEAFAKIRRAKVKLTGGVH